MVQRSKLKMEKSRGTTTTTTRKLRTNLCIPRLRNNSCTNKTKGLSPMRLLERFREAVFRLIMFSAFSKATNHDGSTDVRRHYRADNDHRHSEAVADCIEFIKKKALPDENRDSSASSLVDATAECVIPVPVTM